MLTSSHISTDSHEVLRQALLSAFSFCRRNNTERLRHYSRSLSKNMRESGLEPGSLSLSLLAESLYCSVTEVWSIWYLNPGLWLLSQLTLTFLLSPPGGGSHSGLLSLFPRRPCCGLTAFLRTLVRPNRRCLSFLHMGLKSHFSSPLLAGPGQSCQEMGAQDPSLPPSPLPPPFCLK